uniref:Uncharacterized protein n=1 Tax=Bionectria ochroleuca TaxID=29856 RepID=A0A8H7N7Z9_BIOOC
MRIQDCSSPSSSSSTTSFLKPHQGDAKGTQQDALESFYKKQAGAYDATRKVLLRGREDMLALVAAQLNAKAKANSATADKSEKRRIWVDIGGGTGWNIEAMSAFVDVPNFFPASTSSTFLHLSVRLPGRDSRGWAGRTSQSSVKMPACFVSRITRLECP